MLLGWGQSVVPGGLGSSGRCDLGALKGVLPAVEVILLLVKDRSLQGSVTKHFICLSLLLLFRVRFPCSWE